MNPTYSGAALYNEVVETDHITLLCTDCLDEDSFRIPPHIQLECSYLKGIRYSQLEDDNSDFYELEIRGLIVEWLNTYQCTSKICTQARKEDQKSYDAARAERW